MLDTVRIPRQIVVDHQVSALKIDALTGGIGRDEHPNRRVVLERFLRFHPVFAAYVIACFAYSFHILAAKYRVSTGLLRLQIRYLVFAITISSGLATASNLLVPLLLKTSALSKYGPFFSLLLLGLVGHAIIRHRLMDIRIVIKRSVVYLAAFVAAGLILIMLLVASNLILHEQRQTPLREIILALAVAVFFSPLKGHIQRTFDRYLYREPYDYQRTIREASRALGDTIELPRLLSYLSGLVVRTLKCEGVAIYLLEHDEARFDLAITGTDGKFPDHLSLSSALVARIVRARETVFHDDIVDDPDLSGRWVDLDLRDVGAVGVCGGVNAWVAVRRFPASGWSADPFAVRPPP